MWSLSPTPSILGQVCAHPLIPSVTFQGKDAGRGGTGRDGRTGQAAFLHPTPTPTSQVQTPALLLQSCSDLDQVLHLSVQRFCSLIWLPLCLRGEGMSRLLISLVVS